MLNLSQLKSSPNSRKRKKRVGRGNSSGHGTYSGKGQKGQRSRSGGRKRLKLKGIRPMIKGLPKLGGFRSIHPRPSIINLDNLEKNFSAGEIIDPKKMLERGLVESTKFGVKILGGGKLTKKLIVSADAFSESAEKAIKDAGGEAIIANQH
jgi:large subunit ribosomal protein L15